MGCCVWPLEQLLLALLLGAAALCAYASRHFAYWRCRGVPYLPPLPFAGNLKDVFMGRKHVGTLLREIYMETKTQRFVGLFFFDQPVLLVNDRDIVKAICHKDFQHFMDRSFQPSHSDILNRESLFSREGDAWRSLRVKLSPGFSSGRLKRFYALLEGKAAQLAEYLEAAARAGTVVDAHDACSRFTMDAVSALGLGTEGAALEGDDDPLFRVLHSVFVYSRFLLLGALAQFARVPLAHWLSPALVPAPLVRFLRDAVRRVAGERELSGPAAARGDFLDLLLQLRARGRDSSGLLMDGDVLVAQAFTFLSAGFETSSTTMSFALFHLARDAHAQDELRAQLREALRAHGGHLSYEALQSVAYLDMVLSETLRLHPVLPFMDRVCTKRYRVQDSDLVIERGTVLFASTMGLQRDPELYPDPERFDPQRFSSARRHALPAGAFLSFGDGPRMCIGKRLGLLQAKIGLAHVVLRYRLQPCAETPLSLGYRLESFLLQPSGGVPLKFSCIEDEDLE